MNKSLEINSMELKSVEKADFNDAIKKLNAHMRNKSYFKPYTFSVNHNLIITEDFSSKNKRQSYFYNCTFEHCNFFEAGFAGSVFIKCKFIDCELSFSKFQSCDFRECVITYNGSEKKEVCSVNYNKSMFHCCKFVNIFLNAANFGDSVFDNGEIVKNKWRSVLVENMIIKNSILKDMRFSSQNFDFLTIENITTYDTVIPFPALPNIINGITYLLKTNDNIRFTSCDGKNERICKDKYIELISSFETYYTYVKEYFPLANILISQDRLQEAIYVIYLGIIQSLKLRNFRMIYHFCKLIQINPAFTIQYRKKIYQQIQFEIGKEDLSTEDYMFLNMYLGKIKDLLLNTTNMPCLLLDIKTNIDSSESEKISIFIQKIEYLISSYANENEEHFIEIRHNSWENFIIQITSDPERLIIFLAALLTCIGYGSQFVSFLLKKAKDFVSNTKNIKNKNSNVTLKDDEIAVVKQILEDNNIEILNINYNIFNATVIDPKIQSGYINIKNQ